MWQNFLYPVMKQAWTRHEPCRFRDVYCCLYSRQTVYFVYRRCKPWARNQRPARRVWPSKPLCTPLLDLGIIHRETGYVHYVKAVVEAVETSVYFSETTRRCIEEGLSSSSKKPFSCNAGQARVLSRLNDMHCRASATQRLRLPKAVPMNVKSTILFRRYEAIVS
jgi:hypothetical protein